MQKQKYLIEIGETKNHSDKLYLADSYKKPGWYLNTDETNNFTLVLVTEDSGLAPIVMYDYSDNNFIKKAIGEPYTPPIIPEIPAPPPLELPELPEVEIVDSISQNTFLKALAVGLKPELIKDLVKVDK